MTEGSAAERAKRCTSDRFLVADRRRARAERAASRRHQSRARHGVRALPGRRTRRARPRRRRGARARSRRGARARSPSAPRSSSGCRSGLRERQNELAELLTREQGKPLAQSIAEIDRGAAQSDGMVGIEIPVEVHRRRRRQAHRAALSAARRRRHHHAVERAREPGARPARLGALHRQHGGPEAVAVHAADDAEGRRAPERGLSGRRRQRARGRRRARRVR